VAVRQEALDVLLSQDPAQKVEAFRRCTVAHPHLVEIKDRLLSALCDPEPNCVILVYGAPGVGKTTLRMRLEQLLAEQGSSERNYSPGRIGVSSIEAVATEGGSFNWRDHFKRLLIQLSEPLVEHKLPQSPVDLSTDRLRVPSRRALGSDYRYAVEQAIRFRRPVAVLIDEAQHMVKANSGRRTIDQLDVVKSIANCTTTPHVLFGTYDLLAFRNLNGQLCRRSIDIHFRRYRVDNVDERRAFLNVVRSFQQQIPLAEVPDLIQNWEYLYERSIGCIGVLKQWLNRALACAVNDGTALTVRHLERTAMTVPQISKLLADVMDGEERCRESDADRELLRARLALPSRGASAGTGCPHPSPGTTTKGGRRPGQRSPVRDPIGGDRESNVNAV
jgi:hypothetical protein